ncbi:HDOD domain-containing protein [Dechloromonas sp. XY25]|uniref:HDOD domain-containing protein n=1 Tax=Dechloromonas hankyongensis TaxID=2908002 RepID=A0ABS9K5N0_9RHOO|nr:HDOD domain-containing protein [Dechloromonas hankyongensis]MCG2578453.1 HDOD domain-containing protein [Dechloromonas hankyongensis]
MAAESIHFRILEDIARDLSGDVNFPTCLDAAMLVRNTLRDPLADLQLVVRAISAEPLISSKLLRLANSVVYNPSGATITDLQMAVARLGFEVVRTTSLAVAMEQMLKSRNLSAYDRISHAAWEHSIHVAAIARVLARRLGRINPDEAMLAGLVHNIGIFYLLYRAAEYAEYRDDPTAMVELLAGWHESIGESLLHILGMPEQITDAIRDHDHLRHVETPCTVRDALYFANLLADDDMSWLPSPPLSAADEESRQADRERYADLITEAKEDIEQLYASLAS